MSTPDVGTEQAGSPAFLNVQQTARRVNCSEQTIYEMTWRGDLPTVRIRGRVMIPVEAVEKFIESKRAEALAGGRGRR